MNCFAARLVLWLITLVVYPIPVTVLARSFEIEVLQRINLDAPAREECQEPRCVDVYLAERVLVYLENAERKEIDPWLRDDYRIAWITTRWARDGVPDWSWHRDSSPHVAATYQVLRCHPDEVWPHIVAQRKAKLGPLYEKVWGAELPPKKPVRAEKFAAW